MAVWCIAGNSTGAGYTTIGTKATVQDCVNSVALLPGRTPYISQSAFDIASQPTLSDIFNMPVSADLLQMWELGFGLPVLCYLTAWAYGSLINFFDSKHDN